MMTERLKLVWLHLSWSTKECARAVLMSECECEWIYLGFSFLLCGYALEREGYHLLGAVKPWYLKKKLGGYHLPRWHTTCERCQRVGTYITISFMPGQLRCEVGWIVPSFFVIVPQLYSDQYQLTA